MTLLIHMCRALLLFLAMDALLSIALQEPAPLWLLAPVGFMSGMATTGGAA